MNTYHKIVFYNTCDAANILYQTGFQQMLYLPEETTINTPDYLKEDAAVKDGEETDVVTYQRVQKQYRMKLLAPEYIADVMTMLPLYDTVWLYPKGGGAAEIRDIIPSVKWAAAGCFALIELQFNTSEWIDNTACCANMVIS